MHAARERRWSYSLRTLFVAVTMFGVLLVWIKWQYEAVRERETLINAHVGRYLSKEPARLPFLWSLLGATPVNSISLPEDEFSEDDLVRYRSAFPEADVTLDEHPFIVTSRKRWGRRDAQDRKWIEAWISARNVLDVLAIVAVVAFAFELIRPLARRAAPPSSHEPPSTRY